MAFFRLEKSLSKTNKPPPKVLFIHNGQPVNGHIQHLKDAGLKVRETPGPSAVSSALSFEPDIVVLDFGCDGEVVAALQRAPETKGIPVIALAKLTRAD